MPTGPRGLGARQVRVILLTIVGVLLLVYGVLRVGKIFDVFADRYTLVTLLPSVAGLREGAAVALAGQQVGQIDHIEFIPLRRKRGDSHVLVRFKVAERVREQIRGDSRLQVRPQGLLGDKYMDIQPGTIATAPLQPGDTIPGELTLDTEQFLARAAQAVDQANLVITDLRQLTGSLSRGEGTLGQLLHDDQLYFRMVSTTGELQTLLEELNNGDGALARLIHDPQLYRRLLAAVSRVDSLGSRVLHGQGTLSQLIRSDSLYRGLAGTAAKADNAAAGLAQLLQQLNRPEGSLNRFMTDPRLFDEFLKSVVDFQTLISDVRQNPKKFAPPITVKVF